MKHALNCFVLALLCSPIFSQNAMPVYGKIDKDVLEMTNCSFDDAAEAIVLFDIGEVFCNLNLQSASGNYIRTELSRHVRIKILNEKGLDQANVKIRYNAERNTEQIKNLVAQTINIDAAGNPVYTKVEKSLIYHKKLNKRFSEVIFTFPEVKKGSVIEYKYIDNADNFSALKNWYFQRPVPVQLSQYTMNFPNEIIIAASHKGALQLESKETKKGYRNVKTFTMKNVPALRGEAYISCNEDYMQQVIPMLQAFEITGQPRTNLLRTWPGIIKELMEDEDFGLQLKKNIPRTSDLDTKLASITDPYQKMVIIHEYVRSNMQWNEYYGIWALDGVKAAWKEKKGTSGEINLILVNLLKDADINVHPVLVSTRDNGRVNTGVAGFNQFNKVMAYVEIGKKVYVLDATDKYTPANLVPADVLCSEGLVIEKLSTFEWGWKTLWNPEKTFKNITFLFADIDEKGGMKGEATVTSMDYSRLERMPVLKKGREQLIETYFDNKSTGLKVESLAIENEAVDSLPLVQKVHFSGKTNGSGDYHYFSANLFSGLDKNPFLADERFSDIFFGTNQQYTIIGTIALPDGYVFDELPKNIRMIMPDTSVSFMRILEKNQNSVGIKIQLDIKKPLITVEDYPYFQEFYKKLFELLNEQIVYKKK